jgi:hypothetical protein
MTMPRKTKLVKGYADIMTAGTFGIAGVGALNAVGGVVGPAANPMLGMAGSAMQIGSVGLPLMATGGLMTQMNALGEMATKRRKR